jgi:hypothetical protein
MPPSRVGVLPIDSYMTGIVELDRRDDARLPRELDTKTPVNVNASLFRRSGVDLDFSHDRVENAVRIADGNFRRSPDG